MMSAKIASLGLLKIKVFWKKGYEAKISGHDVTNIILSGESNYTVDAVMWPNFGSSNISMREVIITLIFSWSSIISNLSYMPVWKWVKTQNYKTKSQKGFGSNSYVCRSYTGKMVGDFFCPMPSSQPE